MSEAEKAKWARRAELKAAILADGRRNISGRLLNLKAGLRTDAVWREENFA